MTLAARPIEHSAIEAAFSLLREAARWLDARGRRQRIAATTFESYLRWQTAGSNWGMFEGDELAAVFTLVHEPLRDWPDVGVIGPVPWLRALAVNPARRGEGIGERAIEAVLELVDASEHLYLDCVSDFLPEYYAAQGFERVARQVRAYADGEYDITLMRQAGRARPGIHP